MLEHVTDIAAAFAGLRRLAVPGGAVIVTVPFMFPLHMEPYDFRRLTRHGLERLAADHGFRLESSARLGRLTEVLAMLLADASILPLSRSPLARAKVVLLRGAAAALVRVLDSRALSARAPARMPRERRRARASEGNLPAVARLARSRRVLEPAKKRHGARRAAQK